MRSKLFKFLPFVVSFISIQVFSQYNPNFQVEYFHGNLPSAKVEAMGMADAAIGGTVASSFFNSAGLGGINNQEVHLSTSAPFYILKNSNYNYFGYAKRINSKLVAAFSINNFATRKTTFTVDINNTDYPITKGLSSNYAFSLAGTPIEGLYAGLNFNLYRWKLFRDVNAATTFHIDGGLLYKLDLPEKENIRHHAQFGMSINNFTKSKLSFEAPDGNSATSEFPVIGRYAVAYFLGRDVVLPVAGSGPLDLTFTLEYQNTFNSDYYKTFSFGFESVLWKIFAFRLGYFTQNLDNLGSELNYNRAKDFTYGFGSIIPLNELTNNKFPIIIHLDYLSLKPPLVSDAVASGNIPNMRTFTLRVVWTIDYKPIFEFN